MRTSCLAMAATLLATSGATPGASHTEVACPASIPSSTFKAADAPDGWVASAPNPIKLSAAGMMAGTPESMLYLVPNATTRTTHTFEFEPGDRQRWLWCAYGPAQLSKRLPDSVTRCVITTTDAAPGIPMTARVRCSAA